MNEYDLAAAELPVPEAHIEAQPEAVASHDLTAGPLPEAPHAVDPVRAAAGRLGGQRVHKLAELGREYEKEHGLKPGRQRLRQLIQLGKKYEAEHGLRTTRPRRKKKAEAWQEFLTALARVVKPAYRPAVEQLVAALRTGPRGIAAVPVTDNAA